MARSGQPARQFPQGGILRFVDPNPGHRRMQAGFRNEGNRRGTVSHAGVILRQRVESKEGGLTYLNLLRETTPFHSMTKTIACFEKQIRLSDERPRIGKRSELKLCYNRRHHPPGRLGPHALHGPVHLSAASPNRRIASFSR